YRLRLLDIVSKRQHANKVEEVVKRAQLGDQLLQVRAWLGTEVTKHQEVDHEQRQRTLADPATVTERLDRVAVQPRQQEQDDNGAAHGEQAPGLGGEEHAERSGTQHRVVRAVVPYRRNMIRGLHRVGRLEVRALKQVTAAVREEEDHGGKNHQEDDHADGVLHRVVRVEGNAVNRNAVGILVLLDFNAVRVVGTDFVQGQQVQYHQRQQHDRDRDNVQGKELVDSRFGQQVVTAHPGGQGIADFLAFLRVNERQDVIRHRANQGDDHLGAPVGHVAPRQDVAKETFGHQRQVDQHAEDPHQLARRLVGTVHQAAE